MVCLPACGCGGASKALELAEQGCAFGEARLLLRRGAGRASSQARCSCRDSMFALQAPVLLSLQTALDVSRGGLQAKLRSVQYCAEHPTRQAPTHRTSRPPSTSRQSPRDTPCLATAVQHRPPCCSPVSQPTTARLYDVYSAARFSSARPNRYCRATQTIRSPSWYEHALSIAAKGHPANCICHDIVITFRHQYAFHPAPVRAPLVSTTSRHP